MVVYLMDAIQIRNVDKGSDGIGFVAGTIGIKKGQITTDTLSSRFYLESTSYITKLRVKFDIFSQYWMKKESLK